MESGYHVKYHHHETGKSQHEIEIKELEAMAAADFCSYFKYVAREIATAYHFEITFMPKPFSHEIWHARPCRILFEREEHVR